jgi:hypothetical protein
VLAATNPVISSVDNAIESFILASSIRDFQIAPQNDRPLDTGQGSARLEHRQ